MPALVAGIHVFLRLGASNEDEDVDGRDKPGHDARMWFDMNGSCANLDTTQAILVSPRRDRDASNTCNTIAQSASVILLNMAGLREPAAYESLKL